MAAKQPAGSAQIETRRTRWLDKVRPSALWARVRRVRKAGNLEPAAGVVAGAGMGLLAAAWAVLIVRVGRLGTPEIWMLAGLLVVPLMAAVGALARMHAWSWLAWAAATLSISRQATEDELMAVVPYSMACLLVHWSAGRWTDLPEETIAGGVGLPVGAVLMMAIQWVALFVE